MNDDVIDVGSTMAGHSARNEERRQSDHRIVLPEASGALRADLDRGAAVAWSEPLSILTYDASEPSIHPMYLDHRVYQGSSGTVYPIPFTEQIADEGVVREWQAIHLENEYVRLVVLPELGGRIHIGFDKTTGYDFFYRNNVIKPALVGLAGPWISGGVEFNWPQHHRPGTYLPVETSIENGDDGSVTVWCHDHDPFTRMSAQHGIRLRAGSSVVELVVRLHNRTSERQSFLWWANVAARVHDDYQSFFPQDVRYVADHARRALTAFPEADRPYYGVDYPALAAEREGADRIDFYRNIPVPTSYMIVDSQQDFFGGYDHAAGAGFVHWAERRLAPGKKQWTWGDAPFGHAWDDQLTDADGPYIELMAGVYTDNQPDFAWLLPGETKVFRQHWYPIPAIGAAHQATTDAAVHVERGARVSASFAVTSRRDGATLRILDGGTVVASATADLVPGVPVTIETDAAPTGEVTPELVTAELLAADGSLLVRWAPTDAAEGEPWVADEPPLPDEIDSVEELYLTGLHLQQNRHPTRSPLPYWRAALSRDAGDARTNLALADRAYRAGRFEVAREHAQTAIARLTRRNANPTDTEAYYLGGLILARLGRETEAQRMFGKAGWDGTWAAASGVELVRSLLRAGQQRAALRVLDTLDGVVGHDTRRIALRALILRARGDAAAATAIAREALVADPLDATLRVLAGDEIQADAGLLLDVALDLKLAGAPDDALRLIEAAIAAPISPAGNVRPIAAYVAAEIHANRGDLDAAARQRARARAADLRWAFPAGLDALQALEAAAAAEPDDTVALSLLGMLLYSVGRRRDAADVWNRAIAQGRRDPVLFRNAALAAYNVERDEAKAWRLYAQAVESAPDDARIRYEQDQLAARLGHSTADRLAALRPVEDLVLTRDDFAIEYARLLVAAGEAARAHRILLTRPFHPWEGGEGQAIATWDLTLEALGLPRTDPPATLGEARAAYVPPVAVRDDGVTDYFATSLPELLLFTAADEDESEDG
jgi:tetratricopeptide (TPR) repeat protein